MRYLESTSIYARLFTFMHAIIMTTTTCGENSRAAFSALSVRTTRRDFEGGDNSRCGEILRKYGIISCCMYRLTLSDEILKQVAQEIF